MMASYLEGSAQLILYAIFAPLIIFGIKELIKEKGSILLGLLLIAWGIGCWIGVADANVGRDFLGHWGGPASEGNLAIAGAVGVLNAAIVSSAVLSARWLWSPVGMSLSTIATLAGVGYWLTNSEPFVTQLMMASTVSLQLCAGAGVIWWVRRHWRARVT